MKCLLFSITNETLKPLISPDYAKPTRQVYIDSATYFLSQEDPLYIPPFAGRYVRRFENLPSWVPDRRHPPKAYPFGTPLPGTNYCASGNTSGANKTQVRLRGDPTTVTLKGICVNEVSKLSPLSSTHFHDNSILNSRDTMTIFIPWVEECRNISKYHVKDPYPHRPNESRTEAFWQTGLSDRASGFRPANLTYTQYYRAEQNMALLFLIRRGLCS